MKDVRAEVNQHEHSTQQDHSMTAEVESVEKVGERRALVLEPGEKLPALFAPESTELALLRNYEDQTWQRIFDLKRQDPTSASRQELSILYDSLAAFHRQFDNKEAEIAFLRELDELSHDESTKRRLARALGLNNDRGFIVEYEELLTGSTDFALALGLIDEPSWVRVFSATLRKVPELHVPRSDSEQDGRKKG